MSLYVRLYTDFWSHRKTMKLRSLIGDDALWLPVRLWSYAAEHQLDGCFKEYSPEVLAMLLGYSKDAQAMLQALHQSGFMEDNCIHDWDQHNGFHSKFSQRAKKAADSRWKKEKNQKKEDTETETETSIATSTACRMLEASSSEKKSKSVSLQESLEILLSRLPEEFSESEDFKDHWTGFYQHRVAVKSKLTERAVILFVKDLAEWGVDGSIKSIAETIKSGRWTGLFAPKQNGTPFTGNRITPKKSFNIPNL